MNFANNHFPLAARRAETSLSVTLALLTGILVAVAPATGATTEDQHLLADGQFNAAVTSYQGWGQTFTVGLSGLLTRVDLQLGRQTGTSGPLQVELRKTSGGLPDLTPQALLFSTSIAASAVPVTGSPASFTVFLDLSSAPPSVTPGDCLAILLTNPDTSWYLWSSHYWPGDIYSGGSALKLVSPSAPNWIEVSGYDSGFDTWITQVPEPSALLPVGLLILAVSYRCRSTI